MRTPKPMHPCVPVVMRLIRQGKITIKDAAEVLDRSPRTVQDLMKDYGVEVVKLRTTQSRKEKSEENDRRNALLENLAKQIKYEGKDLNVLCVENIIPVRTMYRWVAKV